MAGFCPYRFVAIGFVILSVSAVDGSLRPVTLPKFGEPRADRQPLAVSIPVSEDAGAEPAAATELSDDTLTAPILRQLIDGGSLFLVDARIPAEFEAGHLPYAVNLTLPDFLAGRPEVLDFHDPSTLTVVYCGGGDCDSSEKVREMLESYGFQSVLVYKEGFPGWIAHGGELMTP
ncbi:MAG: rhodanese-like domain-containing protein [Candidatus Sumerlaeia bacterium]|nr:rhodanese-like domain-containing protein [Candidatus Sumerlaeia bacterium]